MRHRGFTLIELLVVVGILAILAAIIFPVTASVRAKARQSVCLSNLRQLGQATLMYAQDYDDAFPYGGDASDIKINPNWNGWYGYAGGRYWERIKSLRMLPEVMPAYVKDKTLWRCPSDTGYSLGGAFENLPIFASPSSYEAFGMSYGYQTLLALDEQRIGSVLAWSRKPPHDEHHPAQVPLLADSVGKWHGANEQSQKRLNMVMVDGHAMTVDRNKADELMRIQFDIPVGKR